MADLIYKGDVINLLNSEGYTKNMRIHRGILNIRTVDAAEVERCRDCIGRSTWYNDAEYGCAICGMSGMYPKSEDDFCSYGIRKDGDADRS